MTAQGLWLSSAGSEAVEDLPGQPCVVWLNRADHADSRRLGVLILPPIGYESSSSHRLWRTLAEQLASRGLTTVRLDYWATGDSAGYADDVTSLEAWQASVRLAALFLRDEGCQHVAVVGCQLGTMLASLETSSIEPSGVVAVAPTTSGRRFVRGVSVIALRAPEDEGMAIGGHYLGSALLNELATIVVTPPAGIPYLEIAPSRVATALQLPAEAAQTPADVVEEVVDWIDRLELRATSSAMPRSNVRSSRAIELVERGNHFIESFVSLGADGFVGVRTQPASSVPSEAGVYLLVNSGSDPHVGPGRAWVELARYLARLGFTTIRVDMRSWGESPDGPTMPARPYAEHCVDDVISIVDALRAEGTEKVVLGGLCAGAWISMRAATYARVVGSVVLNPQLYWFPGEPWEPLVAQSRARRQAEVAAIKADALTGRWDAEDEAGIRPYAGVLLDELVASGTTTSMVFAEGDDGIEWLRDRLARRLDAVLRTGRVRVTEVADVDHGMQRSWRRPDVFAAISKELGHLLEMDGSARLNGDDGADPVA